MAPKSRRTKSESQFPRQIIVLNINSIRTYRFTRPRIFEVRVLNFASSPYRILFCQDHLLPARIPIPTREMVSGPNHRSPVKGSARSQDFLSSRNTIQSFERVGVIANQGFARLLTQPSRAGLTSDAPTALQEKRRCRPKGRRYKGGERNRPLRQEPEHKGAREVGHHKARRKMARRRRWH